MRTDKELDATSYRVDVQGVGESVWSNNALEFDTPEAADAYARDLGSRWFGIEAYRVVPVSTPKHETVKPEDRKEF